MSHPLLTRKMEWRSRRKQIGKKTENTPHASPRTRPPATAVTANTTMYKMTARLLTFSDAFLRTRKTAKDATYKMEMAAKNEVEHSLSRKYDMYGVAVINPNRSV